MNKVKMEKKPMKKYKVLFTDLDGTLIDTLSGKTFPKGVWDMKLRLDVLEAIKKLSPTYIFIVTNQGGIEKGFVDEMRFINKLVYVKNCIRDFVVDKCVVDSLYCQYNDKNHSDRKPNIGMLEYFFYEYADVKYFSKDEMLMIGDASGKPGQFSDTDKKTAENFGIDYMDVDDFIKAV